MSGRAPDTFDTARLHAHRGGPADEEFVVAMFADPRVHATLGGPRDRDRVRHALGLWDEHWTTHRFGPWIVDDAATGEPAGLPHVLYRLDRTNWEQGTHG